MRHFLLVMALPFVLFGSDVNEALLKIHATLFPKIIMMDYAFEEKLENGAISIMILHEAHDEYYAKRLKELIETGYEKGIRNIPVRAETSTYAQMGSATATCYYLFEAPDDQIQKAVSLSRQKSRLSFAYDEAYLHDGVAVSVKISEKVTPYINVNALKRSGITMRTLLLHVSELLYQKQKE